MRALRRTGDDLKSSAKATLDWDKDDFHHKTAMKALSADIFELAVVRDYYIDKETLLKMYDQYMGYKPSTPVWEQNQRVLYDKLKEKA